MTSAESFGANLFEEKKKKKKSPIHVASVLPLGLRSALHVYRVYVRRIRNTGTSKTAGEFIN